jgi:hypothetical protein
LNRILKDDEARQPQSIACSKRSSASLSRSSRNLRFDLPEAFVKALRNGLLILKCYRKTSTPIVQKLKLLMGRHIFPSRTSHDVALLRCDGHREIGRLGRGRSACPTLNYTARSRGCIVLEKFDGIADSYNPRRVVVRNVATKFLLKGHYYFDDVKAVGAEVLNEARAIDHFIGINSKLLNHDLSNSFSNLAHLSSPIPHFLPGASGVKSTVQTLFRLVA